MTYRVAILLLACLAASIFPGCHVLQHHGDASSPLDEPRVADGGAVLEIYFAHFSEDDPELVHEMWRQLDEQVVDREVRRRLGENGFRIGRVGGHIPVQLQRLLQLTDQPTDSSSPTKIEPEKQGAARKRILRNASGHRSELIASDIYDSLPVLMNEDGQWVGRTYHKAQGILALKSFGESGARVRLDLVPELHHGDANSRYVGTGDGMWRMKSGRPRRVFSNLEFSANLAPGEMIVMSSTPDHRGSLGDHFFSRRSGDRAEQSVLVVRLIQTPPEKLYDDDILPVDEIE
jgi:hypothetical protein